VIIFAQIPPFPELEDALDPSSPLVPPPEMLPWWAWALLALVVIATAVFLWTRLRKPPASPLPPDPRDVALRKIAGLAGSALSESPYVFSIQACDILRWYCETRFGMPATAQTSTEFLDGIRRNPGFAPKEREGLEKFLARCDEIKFARATAGSEDNELLAELARQFVKGGPA
jgi:hypothetical protein